MTAARRTYGFALRAALCACAALALLLVGCAEEGGAASTSPSAPSVPLSQTAADGAAFSHPEELLLDDASELPGDPSIDVSHASDGYVRVRATNPSRLKFQVLHGEQVYNYDMPNDGTPVTVPLNMGDGEYTLRIMQNTSGSNYVQYDALDVDVALSSEFAPFIVPNMFCDYDGASSCVAKALEVTSASANQGEALRDVCSWVAENVSYDYEKAEVLATVTGYIPDPDQTLGSGTGICFDYASLSAAMLRSLGLPTKIVTGYVSPDDIYHAWIMVYIDGTWVTGLFRVDRNTWSRVDVTFAASGVTEIAGEGPGYTDRYVY